MKLEDARQRLDSVGQSHLLTFFDRLAPDAQRVLLDDIAAIDTDRLPAWIDTYVRSKPEFSVPSNVEPAPYYPRDAGAPFRPWDRDKYEAIGRELIGAGKVACFVVAGGQGSRLGYDGPKGCYPAGAVTGKSLFQFFAESIVGEQNRSGARIPFYIMTSPLNHEATETFLKENGCFGLHGGDIMLIQQGTMPSFDMQTGGILLAEQGRVATNPDGHGGSFRALAESGALDDMRTRGIEHISYFQVDNPITRALDPAFIGLHAAADDSSGEMSSKMLPKEYPEEKVGMFCRVDGRTSVIEYSDLPMDLQRERTDDGRLRFAAGNPAMHAISVDFAERINSDPDLELPFHRAEKKVPHVDPETGEQVSPSEPNGIKLERFVFDALPLAGSSIVYEIDRVEEFAPIKNAEGKDSPASSARIQTERAARWLEGVGVEIPRDDDGNADCLIELSPLTATCAEDLRRADLPTKIERGQQIAL